MAYQIDTTRTSANVSVKMVTSTKWIKEMFDDPKAFFTRMADLKYVNYASMALMYEMLDRHFDIQKNSDGSPWAELSLATLELKIMKDTSRIHPHRGAISAEPLIGTGRYKDSLTKQNANSLHKLSNGKNRYMARIGTRLIQGVNELPKGTSYMRENSPKAMFPKRLVPVREVTYFDVETIDKILDLVEENIFNILGE